MIYKTLTIGLLSVIVLIEYLQLNHRNIQQTPEQIAVQQMEAAFTSQSYSQDLQEGWARINSMTHNGL